MIFISWTLSERKDPLLLRALSTPEVVPLGSRYLPAVGDRMPARSFPLPVCILLLFYFLSFTPAPLPLFCALFSFPSALFTPAYYKEFGNLKNALKKKNFLLCFEKVVVLLIVRAMIVLWIDIFPGLFVWPITWYLQRYGVYHPWVFFFFFFFFLKRLESSSACLRSSC